MDDGAYSVLDATDDLEKELKGCWVIVSNEPRDFFNPLLHMYMPFCCIECNSPHKGVFKKRFYALDVHGDKEGHLISGTFLYYNAMDSDRIIKTLKYISPRLKIMHGPDLNFVTNLLNAGNGRRILLDRDCVYSKVKKKSAFKR